MSNRDARKMNAALTAAMGATLRRPSPVAMQTPKILEGG
jgi:hypothetical protein